MSRQCQCIYIKVKVKVLLLYSATQLNQMVSVVLYNLTPGWGLTQPWCEPSPWGDQSRWAAYIPCRASTKCLSSLCCQSQFLHLGEVRCTWSSHLAQGCYSTAGPSHLSHYAAMLAGWSPIHVLTGLMIA